MITQLSTSLLTIFFFFLLQCMDFKLKQPQKHTHKSVLSDSKKTKPISKESKIQKKVINKKNQPSAVRLEAINQTFNKIEQKAEGMFSEVEVGQQNEEKIDYLLSYKEKVKCLCGKNIKYFCLKCMTQNSTLQFPHIELPLSVIVIHHTSEKINKSSILPMRFLCDQIQVQLFHSQKDNENLCRQVLQQEGSYVLYPHVESQKVTQQNVKSIKKIVVLDCTWFQTDFIINSLKGQKKFIRLDNYESVYWRYNHHSDKALSSAEALMYFMREYQGCLGRPSKQYDKLMFLYLLQLKIIHQSWKQEKMEKQEKEEE